MGIEVRFMNKAGNLNNMKYSDVQSFCKAVYEEEISKCIQKGDKDKIEEYRNFVSKYDTFSPYFDFVMYKLGYAFLTPLSGNSASYIMAIDDYLYVICNEGNIKQKFFGYKSDDKTLHIQKANPEYLHNCFINSDGIQFGMEYGIHEGISNTVLNHLLIQNAKIVNLFFENWKNMDYNSYLPLLKLFGFLWVSTDCNFKQILYNNLLLSKEQRNILIYIKEYLAHYQVIPYTLPALEKEKVKEFFWRMKNENR